MSTEGSTILVMVCAWAGIVAAGVTEFTAKEDAKAQYAASESSRCTDDDPSARERCLYTITRGRPH